MSNEKSNETSMILTPRQEHLQRVRDEMAPGEKPAAIVPHTFAEVITMCQALAAADLAPKALRGKATDMALVIMTGAEVGLPPMASLRLYTTWDGVPRLMAEGVRAIILQSPAIEYFEMATCDDNHATWIGKRRGRPEKSVTWTIDRAKRAGLLSKDVWQKYQQDMLNARASMQLGRIIAPDVVAGMVALEEARDGDFLDAQAVESKPVFVAPPPPQGPPPGVPVHAVGHAGPVGTSVPMQSVPLVSSGGVAGSNSGGASTTVTTAATPAEQQKRGPGRPPRDRSAERPTTPASAQAPSPQPSASTSPAANGSTSAAAPADSSPTTDKWGQPVADPTSSGGSSEPAASTSTAATTSTSASSETASTASTGLSRPDTGHVFAPMGAPADDGFGGEDPEDSQPAPTGDPGLQLLAEFQAFIGKCKSQTEMQNGRPPYAQRSAALFKSGDQRFAAATGGKPAGELALRMSQLWAERKAQLPV